MLDKLQEMHAQLSKAKYLYYEAHKSIMTDYEFDMLEKEYAELAEIVGISDRHNASKVIGSGILPRNLNHFYKEVFSVLVFSAENCPPCKRLVKILETKDNNGVDIKIYNVKNSEELVEKYNIKASPTVVYLDKHSNVIKKTVGSTLPHNLKYVEHFG
jgi:thiol-disulfide isomerase/thioredoxin